MRRGLDDSQESRDNFFAIFGSTSVGRDFKGALMVAQKAWWQADANALQHERMGEETGTRGVFNLVEIQNSNQGARS